MTMNGLPAAIFASATSLIAAFGVFAAGFLMRPLGGMVFGHIGDKLGRNPALILYVQAMAVPTLQALVDAGHDVALVVTAKDKRRGRGGALVPSPVKAAALELGHHDHRHLRR